LPLFNSGFIEALRSRKQLKDHIGSSNVALISQDQTIKDWEAALNQASKKQSQEQKKQEQKQQEQPQKQEQKQEQEKEKQEDKPQSSNSNSIVQALQDMQRADIKPKGQQKVTTEGVKPW
jgi:hypothetical protein